MRPMKRRELDQLKLVNIGPHFHIVILFFQRSIEAQNIETGLLLSDTYAVELN